MFPAPEPLPQQPPCVALPGTCSPSSVIPEHLCFPLCSNLHSRPFKSIPKWSFPLLSFPLHLLRNPHSWVDELSSCAPGRLSPGSWPFLFLPWAFSLPGMLLSLCCCCISKTLICFLQVSGGGAAGRCSDCLIEVKSPCPGLFSACVVPRCLCASLFQTWSRLFQAALVRPSVSLCP